MNRSKWMVVIIFLCLLSIAQDLFAKEVPFTLEDRDRLIRLEVKLEEMDKRFEQIDKRFEQIDKRFEQTINFMWMLSAIFIGITGITIGFALWDRRTMIRPFEVKVRQMEEKIEPMEGKVGKLLSSLRDLAKTDKELSMVLERYSLL